MGLHRQVQRPARPGHALAGERDHHRFQQADALDKPNLARAWAGRADRLEEAIAARLLPAYGSERDPVVAPHPTGALSGHADALRGQFETWFRAHRLGPDGTRVPERLWTYFEAAQVHNAFRLGLDDLAWAGLDGMLDEGGTAEWKVSAWGEGLPGGAEGLSDRNGAGRRGWLDPQTAQSGNMPHGWTATGWSWGRTSRVRGVFRAPASASAPCPRASAW